MNTCEFPLNLSVTSSDNTVCQHNSSAVYVRDSWNQQCLQKFQAGCSMWSTRDLPRQDGLVAAASLPFIITSVQHPEVSRNSASSADETSVCSTPPPSLDRLQVPLTPPKLRGPKHPVPDELKDERYFKRRRRNNEAAKRSRRARKERQDADLQRIASIEMENAALRLQVLQLRAEYDTLTQLLLHRHAMQEVTPLFSSTYGQSDTKHT